VDPRELRERREIAQGDAKSVKRDAPRVRLLNTPPHRNLDGELGVDPQAAVEPDRTKASRRGAVRGAIGKPWNWTRISASGLNRSS
jgi:hypothetical protein